MASTGWHHPPRPLPALDFSLERVPIRWQNMSVTCSLYTHVYRGAAGRARITLSRGPAEGMGPTLHLCFATWAPGTELLDANAVLTVRPRSLYLKSFSGDPTVEPGAENQVQTSQGTFLKTLQKEHTVTSNNSGF